MTHDPILSADRYEAAFAEQAMRDARTDMELATAWTEHECDRYEGALRERLDQVYRERFGVLVPYVRAG